MKAIIQGSGKNGKPITTAQLKRLRKVIQKASEERAKRDGTIYDGLNADQKKAIKKSMKEFGVSVKFVNVKTVEGRQAGLNEYCKEIHRSAVKRGWWSRRDRATMAPELLMLIVTEVAEAMEEYRKLGPKHVNTTYFSTPIEGGVALMKPEGIPAELADVFIRLCDTCEGLGINLADAVETKMRFNSTRSWRHGNKHA